jgi:mxaK protein
VRRRVAHTLFAAAVIGSGALTVHQVAQLQQAMRINAAIANAQEESSALDETAPEAKFARAVAWSEAGDFEAALRTYKALTQGDDPALKLAALYNLGNLHLREALKDGADEAFRSLPLVELAKQNYRDLLRRDPDDWDARYNLELALWLAPEADDAAVEEDLPEQEDRVMSTVQGARLDLP